MIDWENCTSGSPTADLARSIFLIRDAAMIGGGGPVPGLLVRAIRRRFLGAYLGAYRVRRRIDEVALEAWRLPILAARLAEGIAAEWDGLRRAIQVELAAAGRGS